MAQEVVISGAVGMRAAKVNGRFEQMERERVEQKVEGDVLAVQRWEHAMKAKLTANGADKEPEAEARGSASLPQPLLEVDGADESEPTEEWTGASGSVHLVSPVNSGPRKKARKEKGGGKLCKFGAK